MSARFIKIKVTQVHQYAARPTVLGVLLASSKTLLYNQGAIGRHVTSIQVV
jgi:hypothetical protein